MIKMAKPYLWELRRGATLPDNHETEGSASLTVPESTESTGTDEARIAHPGMERFRPGAREKGHPGAFKGIFGQKEAGTARYGVPVCFGLKEVSDRV